MNDRDRVLELERAAEAAYATMYDVRLHSVKDFYDDARFNFQRAIEAAEAANLADDIARLTRRLEHVAHVYNNQFRGLRR